MSGHFTAADVVAHAAKNKVPIIDVQLRKFLAQGQDAQAAIDKLTRKGSHKLKKHREPNETEKSFADLFLEPMLRRGDIDHYGFEEITLRWGDLEYTPDYFVIRRRCTVQYAGLAVPAETAGAYLIEAVYIELKGGWKWEDSIIKFKSFRRAMRWAQFQFHQKLEGRWEQLA